MPLLRIEVSGSVEELAGSEHGDKFLCPLVFLFVFPRLGTFPCARVCKGKCTMHFKQSIR